MSGGLSVILDARDLERLGNLIGAAGKNASLAIARAINHTGDKAKTRMTRVLPRQTGLKRRVIVKALRVTNASPGTMAYTIRSAGGDIALKYFEARETRAGVSAAPWSMRSVYPHTFMKAGWFPRRVTKGNWNGHVFERTGTKTKTKHKEKGEGGMDRFEKTKSGVVIPEEMVKGASAEAFHSVVASDLPARLARELGRVIGE